MAKRGIITIPKSVRECYGLQPGDVFTLLDLDGILVLNPRPSEIDAIADRLSARWSEDGETLESMLQTLRAERDKRDR